ncbi:MAG TPA: AtpZ/AtpI family protein [Candidatus Doudnabacteria bacterium]|nr:AtpZ/AtpI family protein [Candidatus Doudnabacteria bacterium]
MQNPETKPTETDKKKRVLAKQVTFQKTLSLALQFAFIIILPLLVFASIGKWLEARYDNKLWLIAGLLLALSVSTIWFYRKIAEIYKDFID